MARKLRFLIGLRGVAKQPSETSFTKLCYTVKFLFLSPLLSLRPLQKLKAVLLSKKMFISERDQDRDTKKEQTLSITFSQSDWFLFQMSVSDWLLQLRGTLA